MIDLLITRRVISIPRTVQALVSNSLTRNAVEGRAQQAIASHSTLDLAFPMTISETALDWMMVKYSEQAVFNPRREIQHWFAYSSGAHLEPGYMPLFYFRQSKDRPSANKSAISAIGEGVAGFLAQRLYGCTKLARPNHDYPDIVMEASGVTYLVEAKATVIKNPASELDANLLWFVSHTATAAGMDVRPVKGLLISTRINTDTDYSCEFAEVEILP
jgi:hypothetical protein